MNSTPLGTLSLSGKDTGIAGILYDKIAATKDTKLLLLSCVTHGQIAKALRAILNGGADCSISGKGLPLDRPSVAGSAGTKDEYTLRVVDDGYTTYVHRLDYGMAHVLCVAREPGFLVSVNRRRLWNELQTERYTTPLLPEWLPYVEDSLREKELLTDAWCAGCHCGVLLATSEQLDEIVSQGLRDGAIAFP